MSYVDTFITVAPDCPVSFGVVPAGRGGVKTTAVLEYELLSERPYFYTEDDLLYEVHVRRKGIPDDVLAAEGARIRDELLRKPHACLRASPLPKKYGWGLHYDAEGKIALYGMETDAYREFVRNADGKLKLIPAMRSSRGG